MTAPRQAIALPTLNLDAMEKQIAEQQKITEGAQVYSRSQILLEAAEKEAKELEGEGKIERKQIARLEKMVTDLNGILELRRANERDIAVELAATLQQINTLRQAGVTL